MSMKLLVSHLLLAGAIGLAGVGLGAQPAPPPMPDTLDLKAAIGLAVENNYAIRQARERIKEQEGVEITVRARQLPAWAASGSYTGNAREISTYAPQNDQAWVVALQARQVLYAGGGVSAAVKSSAQARAAAVLELQAVINSQLLAVRTQFYTVLLDREQIQVQEENVNLLEEQLKDAQSRFNAGTTSNFEVLRAEVALANGQPPLIQARNEYRVAVEQLRQLLGLGDGGGGERDEGAGVRGGAGGGAAGDPAAGRCAGGGAGQPARAAAAGPAGERRGAERRGQPRELSAGD